MVSKAMSYGAEENPTQLQDDTPNAHPDGSVEEASKRSGNKTGREKSHPVKFTFYFTPSTLDCLERAWFELRQRTGRKVSKSEIVDRVLRDSIEDIDHLQRLLESI